MNVASQSPVHLISGMQSEAIDSEAEVDASMLTNDGEARTPEKGFVPPNRAARRRLAWQARVSEADLSGLANRANEIEAAKTKTTHEDEAFDAGEAMQVRPSTKLSTSALERFERLIEQAQARPQIAVGLVAAAGIMVTTLVWSKAGRLVLLAAGGYVADRLYGRKVGKKVQTVVKRISRRIPAKLGR